MTLSVSTVVVRKLCSRDLCLKQNIRKRAGCLFLYQQVEGTLCLEHYKKAAQHVLRCAVQVGLNAGSRIHGYLRP